MKTYDKASWHIDGGERASDVVARFRVVFDFLQDKKMLTADGAETLEYGMDSSVSLNSTMVTEEGNAFLDQFYDAVIAVTPLEIRKNLIAAFEKFSVVE